MNQNNRAQQTGGYGAMLAGKYLPAPVSVGTVSPLATFALNRELIISNTLTKPGLNAKPNFSGDIYTAQQYWRGQVQTVAPPATPMENNQALLPPLPVYPPNSEI